MATKHSMKYVVPLMAWTLATPLLPLAWAADDLNLIRRASLGIFVRLYSASDAT
jgi:hypothetical protein